MNKDGVKPLLGVIGGMGADATACFYEKLHCAQAVASEQEYIDVLIYSATTTPDRTAFIIGESTESPLSSLVHAACTLENAGATHIAIPCVTAHFFYNELTASVNVPVINLLEEIARYVFKHKFEKVGLLATEGTLQSKLFHSEFEKSGVALITPSDDIQTELTDIIYRIKQGKVTPPDAIENMVSKLRNAGADAVILGCTELCTCQAIDNTIDTLDILVNASLSYCSPD